MYTEIGEHVDLCQGDIIGNIVLSRIPNLAAPILYDNDGNLVALNLQNQLPDGLTVLTPAEKASVIILSQCCDCLRKPYILTARLIPLADFDASYAAKGARRQTEHIQENYQRAGARPDVFYLQEHSEIGFPKSVAYLLELYSLPRALNEEYLRANRLLRLSQQAVFDLQFRFAFCFGRFATDEDYMLSDADKASLQPAVEAQAAVAPVQE
jgi:hypothetical protein